MHASRAATIVALLITFAATPGHANGQTIRIGVAVSLKDAIAEIASAYTAETGQKVELSFGSSGQIYAQIRSGARIDLFFSAASKHVDDLAADGLILPETRRTVAGNTLVLIVPANARGAPDSFEALAQTSFKRLAVGEPNTVPAGLYADEVLEHLGLAEKLRGKLIHAANVRQVLSYVERGEVSAGIVYETEARQAAGKVRVVATAPPGSHQQIVYPAVVIRSSRHPDAARRFVDYVASSASARRVLLSKGFTAAVISTTQPTE